MSKGSFSRVFAFVLILMLALGLFACAPDYTGDDRLGEYVDAETEKYRLILGGDGTGSITHTSQLGIITSEPIVFEFEENNTVSILGTLDGGGVIGREEYRATFTKVDGFYCMELKHADSGNTLGTFYRTQKND